MSEPSPAAEPDSAPETPSDAPKVSWRVRALAMTLLIVITLMVCELLLRVLDKDVYLQRRLRAGGLLEPYLPNSSADLLMDEFRVTYSINQFGYRDRADRQESKGSKARVMVLGDSFAAGWGVEGQQTFAHLIEQGGPAEVWNVAKNGGCALWYVHQARYLIQRFKADALIVQIFDNDPADCQLYAKKLGAETKKTIADLPPEFQRRTGLVGFFEDSFEGLILRKRWRKFRRRLKTGEPVPRENYVDVGAHPDFKVLSRAQIREKYGEQLKENRLTGDFAFHNPKLQGQWLDAFRFHARTLKQLMKECQQQNVRVAVLYIPCYSAIEGSRPLAKKISDNALNQQLRGLCRSQKLPFLDATEVFAADAKTPASDYYHLWDGHLNAKGHKALADKLKLWLPQIWPKLWPK